jgi:hypothetical protein
MKRPESGRPGEIPPLPAVDEEFERKYPTLWEYLTCDTWEDGSPRATTTMFLFVSGGRWTCMLKDRALEKVCFSTHDTLAELLASREEALCDGRADWRTERSAPGRGRKG